LLYDLGKFAESFQNLRPDLKSAAQEAINIYQVKTNGIVNQANNNAYDRAANILKTIKN